MKSAEEKEQRAEFNRCAKKTMRSFGVSFLCATFINIIHKKLLNGDYKTKEEYEDAVHKIEDFCKVKLLDRMPEYETPQMNIDHTNLLKALKREEPKEPTDKEKIEAANELHDWLTKKEPEK